MVVGYHHFRKPPYTCYIHIHPIKVAVWKLKVCFQVHQDRKYKRPWWRVRRMKPSRWKDGLNAPTGLKLTWAPRPFASKGEDRIPTIHFEVLLVIGSVRFMCFFVGNKTESTELMCVWLMGRRGYDCIGFKRNSTQMSRKIRNCACLKITDF